MFAEVLALWLVLGLPITKSVVQFLIRALIYNLSASYDNNNNNNNNNGYFKVLFLRRALSPFNIIKKQQQRCEHRIRKNQQIKSTVLDAN